MSKDEQIAALELQVSQLTAGLMAALAEIVELKQQLSKNSRNSDKPPSSDGLAKKPAIPRRRGQRKSGGQPGHPGASLKASPQPDHLKIHPVLTTHCDCGCSLVAVSGSTDHWDRRQVFDLPPTLLEVTEHRLEQKTCPDCRRKHLGCFHKAVNAPVQYGERVRALAVLLNVEQSLPLARVQEVFGSLTGQAINESTIHTAVERTHHELAEEEQLIHQALLQAEVAHADETGGRIEGKLHWIHGFGFSLYTLFKVYAQRGGSVINGADSHLTGFTGRLIHDCLNSYLVMEGDLTHGICNAHLLRELTALIESDEMVTWSGQMHGLLMDYYRASDKGCGVVPPQTLALLNARYTDLLALTDREEAAATKGKRGRPKKSKGRNLADRFKNGKAQSLLLPATRKCRSPIILASATYGPGKRNLRLAAASVH